MPTRTASCCCGQLRIDVVAEPNGIGICHCLACQRRTGSLFAPVAGFPLPYTVSGRSTTWVRTGDAGCGFVYHFCPVCGTTVFHTEDDVEDEVFVAVGAFADPAFPPPQISVYDCRRHPWVRLPAGTRVFERDPDRGPG